MSAIKLLTDWTLAVPVGTHPTLMWPLSIFVVEPSDYSSIQYDIW